MTGTRRRFATGAVLLALVVTAFEGTVVTTAMPTIARALGIAGGAASPAYAWVFTAFLLTSTVGVLACGRLADVYGRRPVFAGGVALFLAGSALCGLAPSAGWLVAFRAVQGLGAGAVHPVAMVIAGDLYTLEERARVQAFFTGTWAAANFTGPLVGGWLATHAGWRWVFFVNLVPGVLALATMAAAYVDRPAATRLFAPLVTPSAAADPIVRTGLVASLAGGGLVNAALAYVPPLMERELGAAPMVAGAALVALLLGWSAGSTVGVPVYVRRGMRASVGGGLLVAAAGFALAAALLTARAGALALLPALFVAGAGFGPALSTSMVGPQARVAWQERGMLTSIIYAMRALGGALFVWALAGEASGAARFAALSGVAAAAAVVGLRTPRMPHAPASELRWTHDAANGGSGDGGGDPALARARARGDDHGEPERLVREDRGRAAG